MKYFLFSLLLVPTLAFAQATRDVQKKASRQTANVETMTADKTLTYLDAETQLLTPSGGNRIVTLPSTGVWKAWTVKIVNEDVTNTLVIKSSDGDTLNTIGFGDAQYIARQAAPTDSTHWKMISSRRTPTIQKFESTGSGTYATPTGVAYIRVRMVGGGGGGGGGGTAGGAAGGSGGSSTFGPLTAGGGSGGTNWSDGSGANGGTASLGLGPVGLAISGGKGGFSALFMGTAPSASGGHGGASCFGGNGGGGRSATAGTNGTTNTGGGGGGGGNSSATNAGGGGGGGSGGCIDAFIYSPASSYSYSVGSAGTAGGAGTSGGAGGAGGSGVIIVEEYYQ